MSNGDGGDKTKHVIALTTDELRALNDAAALALQKRHARATGSDLVDAKIKLERAILTHSDRRHG